MTVALTGSLNSVQVLIVGAGPFGLSLAAYLQHLKIDYLMTGKPMHFWRSHMPQGMLLRSTADWHLDPLNIDTMDAYMQTRNLTRADVQPLSLDFYLAYCNWFQEQKGLQIWPEYVARLDQSDGCFLATMENGETIHAENVVLALGFQSFSHIPANLARMLPTGRYGHTCDLVHLARYSGKRVLIIGGRQSAFEWASLLHEAGSSAVYICYRHETPQFTESDWSWFEQKVAEMVDDPGWFRGLDAEEQGEVNGRFWSEGRRKLEPWLAPRINQEGITLWPHTEMRACNVGTDGGLQIGLSGGETVVVDEVIFATGYKVDMARIPLLVQGNILDRLATHSGFPQLDLGFQSNIPGLYITSMPAVKDFGLFMAFTISACSSARIIGRAVQGS